MSRTDLIADAFASIKNSISAKKEDVLVPYSNLLLRICEILKSKEYIENFKEVELGKFRKIKIYLRYQGKKSVITELRKVSRPGRRIYVTNREIPAVLRGYGTAIVSTSKGVFTDDEARNEGVGGEVLGMVW